MKPHGLTLIELLTSLTIVSLILAFGIPSFSKQISESRTKTAALVLLDAIETTRTNAVFLNQHVLLNATDKKWHKGWTLFVDRDRNGNIGDGDKTIQINQGLDGVISKASSPMNAYVAFVGSGEGRQIGANGRGGFLSGNIKICPTEKGEGYSLILSKGGRTRIARLSIADCDAIR